MPHSSAQIGSGYGSSTPSLNTDRSTWDEFHLARGPGSRSTGPRAEITADTEDTIPSFDGRGRPRLVTGAYAMEAASAIASRAWEPLNPHNRSTGLPGQGALPYAGLADWLDPNSNARIDVVGVYGEIVFVADPLMSRTAQELYVEQAIVQARRAPTGRRLLDDLADESGLPIVVRLNDQRSNGIDFPEDINATAPEGASGPAVRLRSNYDMVFWDPTSSPVSNAGAAAPPALVLIHELFHAEQYAEERGRIQASPDFPDGVIQRPIDYYYDIDADRNGVMDREDEATAAENIFLKELGLQPLRERYDSGIVGFIEVTRADAVPTEQQIRTLLQGTTQRTQSNGV